MRTYEPRITIGVVLEFEKMTETSSFLNPQAALSSVTNVMSLLYCAVKYQYPRLSYEKFCEDLKPDDLGTVYVRLAEEWAAFFRSLGRRENAAGEAESQSHGETSGS